MVIERLQEDIKKAKKLLGEKRVTKIKKRETKWPDGTTQSDEDLSWEED